MYQVKSLEFISTVLVKKTTMNNPKVKKREKVI